MYTGRTVTAKHSTPREVWVCASCVCVCLSPPERVDTNGTFTVVFKAEIASNQKFNHMPVFILAQ